MRGGKHSSVRWRIVLIYFMLVFIAMTIVSVFLMDRLEGYQINSLKSNIVSTVSGSNLLNSLGEYDELSEHGEEIRRSFNQSWSGSFSEEISVVGRDLNIYASTNSSLIGRSAGEVFDTGLIAASLMNGEDGESESLTGAIPVKNYCFAVHGKSGGVTGAVFVRADLTGIRSFISSSRMLFIEAIALALAITIVLGFFFSRSITGPITELTSSVQKMSQGDLSQQIESRSTDEIGQLAEVFDTMRRRLNETMSEMSNEKNKLETILKYMADGLIAVDLSGRIIHINPAACDMLGYSRGEDLTGSAYNDVLGRYGSETEFDHIVESCREEGSQGTFDMDGRIYAMRYDRFKDENGSDIGIIMIIQDITESQQLENMQTDFVANVSHELKTPLTNIKSYTETLLDGALEDRETSKHFLGIIDSEADRMNRLVKDLLQLSRMDNGKTNRNFKESNVIALLSTAVAKMEVAAENKHQQLNVLYDRGADIRAMVDRDSFEQVILNVLSNAIKYTDDGGRIDVDAVEHGNSVRISVKDTGIGIPPEALPRIFERFYRVDKARSRAMGGTGLGLAITKQIVEEHGGTIEAESREDDGTKFIITLPLAARRGIRNID